MTTGSRHRFADLEPQPPDRQRARVNGVHARWTSTQPSSSGRWAPLISPHRPRPSVPSHRSGSSRSRNSRNWRTCHVGRRAGARTGRARARPSPVAVQPSFSQRSVSGLVVRRRPTSASAPSSPSAEKACVRRWHWHRSQAAVAPDTVCRVIATGRGRRRYVLATCPPLDAGRGADRPRPSGWCWRPTWCRRRGRAAVRQPAVDGYAVRSRRPGRRSRSSSPSSARSPPAPRTDRALGAGRGDPDHDRRADARRRRRRRDGRGHRATRRRPTGCASARPSPRATPCAGAGDDVARRRPCCSAPARSSRPAVAGVLASVNARTVPASPAGARRRCCRPATSWSTTARRCGPARSARATGRCSLGLRRRGRRATSVDLGVVARRRGRARSACCATAAIACDADRHQRRGEHGRLRRRQGGARRASPTCAGCRSPSSRPSRSPSACSTAAAATCRCSACPATRCRSLVSFELFARPALRQMMGHRRRRPAAGRRRSPTTALRRRPDGKTHLVRVHGAFGADGRCARPRRSAPRAATSWRPRPLANAPRRAPRRRRRRRRAPTSTSSSCGRSAGRPWQLP